MVKYVNLLWKNHNTLTVKGGGVNPYALTVSCKKTPKKNFLTTDPPLTPLPAGTRKKFGICQNFLTWPYKTTLKMHFSASSQWSKICFGYQGIIFNGKKGLTFSQIVLVRLEGGDPPPQSGQPDRFFTVFFWPLPLPFCWIQSIQIVFGFINVMIFRNGTMSLI